MDVIDTLSLAIHVLICWTVVKGTDEILTCRPWPVEGMRSPSSLANKCYVRSEFEKTWHEARDFCGQHGGHLATMPSAEEDLTVELGVDKNCFYIGLTKEEDGIWRWLDGSPLTYENWAPTYLGWLWEVWSHCAASCRHRYKCTLYQWERKTCSASSKFVCEYGKFTNIVARWPGSTHDSHIFTTSMLCDYIDANHHGLEDGLILGDSGYPCRPYLMTPFLAPFKDSEKNFNKAQKSTRVTVERTFGQWKRRFHILHSEMLSPSLRAKMDKKVKLFLVDRLGCPTWSSLMDDKPFLFGEKCYIGKHERKTWHQAREVCVKYGGDLVQISSREEHDAVKGGIIDPYFFIGLHRFNGEWRWIDGSPVAFNLWSTDVLNYVVQIWWKCGAMSPVASCPMLYNWGPADCASPAAFICEFDAVVVKPRVTRRLRQKRQVKRTAFRLSNQFQHHRLVSKPDIRTTAAFTTTCSRLCETSLKTCAVYNFHATTKTCLGFSSAAVLTGKKEVSAGWEVWESF